LAAVRAASILEQEIREQPALLARRRGLAEDSVHEGARLLTRADVTHLVVAGRGSSDNAARYAQYLMGRTLRLGVYLAAPSLYAEATPPRLDGAAVLGISQSGQSPDIVGVLEAARRQGRPTMAITNDLTSPLATLADVAIPLLSGPENSVAATKTYTATLQTIVQLAAAAGGVGLAADLDRLPDLLNKVIDTALSFAEPLIANSDSERDVSLTAVGRGTGFATAAETALKIREVAGVRAEAYAVPDLLHGPIAANRAGSALWLVASPDHPLSYWDQLTARLTAEGVRVIALVSSAGTQLTAETVRPLPEELPAWLFDLLAVAYGQVAALRLGEQRGLDVDHPHGLSKITLTE
jgi:glutamine---fructose-6-phosphate transaminase (isomerizing)